MDAPDLKSSVRFLPARFLFNGIDLIYTNRYAKSNPGRHVRIGQHRGSLLPLALAHGEQATARRPVHRSPRNPVLPSAIPQIRTTHTKLTMPQSYFTPQFQSPHNADPRSTVLRDLGRPTVLRCEIPGAHAEVSARRYFHCLLTTPEKGVGANLDAPAVAEARSHGAAEAVHDGEQFRGPRSPTQRSEATSTSPAPRRNH